MRYEIHRYPAELIDVMHVARGGRDVRIVVRPVLPQDDAPTAAFFASLSQQSRRNRFMAPLREVAPGLITAFTQIDYEGHVALVAEVFEDGVETVIAEVRYVRSADRRSAEFAVTVAEAWQGLGLARKLLAKLVCHAGAAGVERLLGETLAGNEAMLHLARKAGFTLTPDPQLQGVVLLERVVPMERKGMPCGAHTA
jgi:acetyltransferase